MTFDYSQTGLRRTLDLCVPFPQRFWFASVPKASTSPPLRLQWRILQTPILDVQVGSVVGSWLIHNLGSALALAPALSVLNKDPWTERLPSEGLSGVLMGITAK